MSGEGFNLSSMGLPAAFGSQSQKPSTTKSTPSNTTLPAVQLAQPSTEPGKNNWPARTAQRGGNEGTRGGSEFRGRGRGFGERGHGNGGGQRGGRGGARGGGRGRDGGSSFKRPRFDGPGGSHEGGGGSASMGFFKASFFADPWSHLE